MTAYSSRLSLPNSSASPTKTISDPTYTGLRTYRLNPLTTRCRVGASGRGVPSARANCTNTLATGTIPAAIRTTPAACATTQKGHGRRNSQPVTSHGIKTANVPAAAAKYAALPITAVDLRTGHLQGALPA
jgi:hypothetical protein